MAEWAVIADDLTGANTAGVLLTNSYFRTLTTIEHGTIEKFHLEDYDAIVVNASSRTLDAAEAYERIRECTGQLLQRGITRFSKRIDSTIRGNLGAEIEGMMDALPDNAIACVVAVYPASGRMVVGGYQLVNGVPVHKTPAGSDPVKPVHSSALSEEISTQTALPQGFIPLSVTLQGSEAITAAARRQIEQGARILLFDAITFADIGAIAEGINRLQVPWFAVDPGPFTQKACELAYLGKQRVTRKKAGKVFIVAASASDLTRSQLTYLQNECQAHIIDVDIRHFLDSDEEQPVEEVIAREIWEISQCNDVFGLRAAGNKEFLIDIKAEAHKRGITQDDIARRITYGLARIARKALQPGINYLKGIYLTGGDMTVAFCRESQVEAIELIDEVQPHISFGTLVGGPLHGIALITKGGLIGETNTVMVCTKYLLNY